MTMHQRRPFPPGIHVPSLTFFEADGRQDIDWDTQESHLRYLVQAGVQGIVVAGTCGEAATLTAAEKSQLIARAARIATDNAKDELTVTAGCSGSCTRDVIDQTCAAQRSGADFALVLAPGSFAFDMDQTAIVAFFQEVADASPIPIIIYNFPSIVNGLNLSPETLQLLGRHSNIAAVKLTCGGIAKVAAVAATAPPESFAALAGQGDWLLPALSVGGVGCIAGASNLFPQTLVEIRRLFVKGDMAAAAELQRRMSLAEQGFAQAGLNGTKWLVVSNRGYPAASVHCRRPIPRFADVKKMAEVAEVVSAVLPIEHKLAQQGAGS
ncbi:hypothetical protein PLICBS_009873 [Purpureocillium lilacinum]|nr:hypothetical protein PLICBS_009873 [Purpureocillium lilacinum]